MNELDRYLKDLQDKEAPVGNELDRFLAGALEEPTLVKGGLPPEAPQPTTLQGVDTRTATPTPVDKVEKRGAIIPGVIDAAQESGKSLVKAAIQTAPAISHAKAAHEASVLKAAEGLGWDEKGSGLDPLRQRLSESRETARTTKDAADRLTNSDLLKRDPNYSKLKGPVGKWVQDAVEASGPTLFGMALAASGNPALAAGFFSSQIMGAKYDQLAKETGDDERASLAALKTMMETMPLEYVGVHSIPPKLRAKMLKQFKVPEKFIDKLGSTRAYKYLAAAFGEGGTEYLQKYPESWNDFVAKNPEMTPHQLITGFLETIPQVHKEGFYEGSIGAGMGVGTNVGIDTVEAVQKKKPTKTSTEVQASKDALLKKFKDALEMPEPPMARGNKELNQIKAAQAAVKSPVKKAVETGSTNKDVTRIQKAQHDADPKVIKEREKANKKTAELNNKIDNLLEEYDGAVPESVTAKIKKLNAELRVVEDHPQSTEPTMEKWKREAAERAGEDTRTPRQRELDTERAVAEVELQNQSAALETPTPTELDNVKLPKRKEQLIAERRAKQDQAIDIAEQAVIEHGPELATLQAEDVVELLKPLVNNPDKTVTDMLKTVDEYVIEGKKANRPDTSLDEVTDRQYTEQELEEDAWASEVLGVDPDIVATERIKQDNQESLAQFAEEAPKAQERVEPGGKKLKKVINKVTKPLKNQKGAVGKDINKVDPTETTKTIQEKFPESELKYDGPFVGPVEAHSFTPQAGPAKGYTFSVKTPDVASVEAAYNQKVKEVTSSKKKPSKLSTDYHKARDTFRASGRVAKAEAGAAVRKAGLPVEVVVEKSAKDFPKSLTKSHTDKGVDLDSINGLIDYDTGTVYIAANNHHSTDEVIGTLVHEAVGHLGVHKTLNDPELNTLLDQLYKDNEGTYELNSIIASQKFKKNTTSGQRDAAAELLADMAKTAKKPSVVTKVFSAIRKALRRMGIVKRWSDKDIQALLDKAKKSLGTTASTKTSKTGTSLQISELVNKLIDPNTATIVDQRTAKQLLNDAKLSENVRAVVERELLKLSPAEFSKYIEGIDSNRVSGLKEREDLTLFAPINPASHLATQNPTFGAAYDVLSGMEEEIHRALYESAKELKSTAKSLLKNAALNEEVTTLIVGLDGKKFRGVEPSIVTNKDGELTLNEKHYKQVVDLLVLKGTSRKAAEAFTTIRRSLDKDLTLIYNTFQKSDLLTEKNLKDMRESVGTIHNYFPHVRTGKYYLRAVDQEGNTVYREHFDLPRDVGNKYKPTHNFTKKRLSAYKKEVMERENLGEGITWEEPNLVSKAPVDYQGQQHMSASLLDQVMGTAIDALKNTGADADLIKNMEKILPKNLRDLNKKRGTGWKTHLIHRDDVAGYETENILGSIATYKAGLYHTVHRAAASRKLADIMQTIDPEVNKNLWKATNNLVKDMFAASDLTDQVNHKIKTLVFINYLGLKLSTASLNLTQNVILGIPTLGLDLGVVDSAAVRLLHATAKDLSDVTAHLVGKAVNKRGARTLSAEHQNLIREFEHIGLIGSAMVDELADFNRGLGDKGFEKTMHFMAWPLAVVERHNRTVMALAAYDAARNGKIVRDKTLAAYGLKKGEKASVEVATRYAKHMVKGAHLVYGKLNRPAAIRGGMGKKFQSLYTLWTYPHQFSLIAKRWATGKEGVAGYAALAKTTAGMWALGGLVGVPMFNSMMSFLRQFTADDPEDEIVDSITSLLPENVQQSAEDIIKYGPLAPHGLSFSNSIAMNLPRFERASMVDVFSKQTAPLILQMFAPVGMITDYFKAMKAYRAGQPMSRVLEYIIPNKAFVNFFLRGPRLRTEGTTSVTGAPHNYPGMKSLGPRKYTAREAIFKMFSLPVLEEQKLWRALEKESDLKVFQAREKDKMGIKIYNGLKKYATDPSEESFNKLVSIAETIDAYNRLAEERMWPLFDWEQHVTKKYGDIPNTKKNLRRAYEFFKTMSIKPDEEIRRQLETSKEVERGNEESLNPFELLKKLLWETDQEDGKHPRESSIELIKEREGRYDKVYQDRHVLSGGWGHQLTKQERLKYPKGSRIPRSVQEAWLVEDFQKAYEAAEYQAAEIGLPEEKVLLEALASVNYQLGTSWHKEHKNTWKLLLDNRWDDAAEEAAESDWYAQTPKRVKDFQKALRKLPTTQARR